MIDKAHKISARKDNKYKLYTFGRRELIRVDIPLDALNRARMVSDSLPLSIGGFETDSMKKNINELVKRLNAGQRIRKPNYYLRASPEEVEIAYPDYDGWPSIRTPIALDSVRSGTVAVTERAVKKTLGHEFGGDDIDDDVSPPKYSNCEVKKFLVHDDDKELWDNVREALLEKRDDLVDVEPEDI